MDNLIRANYDGQHVMAGGILYNDSHLCLLTASEEWRECARAVVRSAQEDTDWAYRLMGARAARYRRNISKALKERAEKKER